MGTSYLRYFRTKTGMNQREFAEKIQEYSGRRFVQEQLSAYEMQRRTMPQEVRQLFFSFFLEKYPDVIPDWFSEQLFQEYIEL